MALGLPVVLVDRLRAARDATRHDGDADVHAGRNADDDGPRRDRATMALKAAPHVQLVPHRARWHVRARRVHRDHRGVHGHARARCRTIRVAARRAGRLSQRDQILLTDFRTTNVDSTLGRVVSDAVRAGLCGSSAFTLVSPTAIVSALKRMTMEPATRVDSCGGSRDRAARRIQGDRRWRRDRRARRIHRLDPTRSSRFGCGNGVVPRDGRRTSRIDRRRRQARAGAARQGWRIAAVGERDAAARSSHYELARCAAKVQRGSPRQRRWATTEPLPSRARQSRSTPTFASAWSGLGALLSNYGGTRSAIDSALTQAYRYRDRLPVLERDRVVPLAFTDWGQDVIVPSRSAHTKAHYPAWRQQQRRDGQHCRDAPNPPRLRAGGVAQYPRGKVLAREPRRGLGNAVEMQLNQGKVSEAAATAARIGEDIAHGTLHMSGSHVLYAQGEDSALHALADSLARKGEGLRHLFGLNTLRSLSLRDGRLADQERRRKEMTASRVLVRHCRTIPSMRSGSMRW